MKLSAIHSYPLKSARGRRHAEIEVCSRGLYGDRRWMLVDEQQRFVTGRIQPQLVRLHCALEEDGALRMAWEDGSEFCEAQPRPDGPRLLVKVWSDQVDAAAATSAANQWLSDRLGCAVQLVYMDNASTRLSTTKHGRQPQPVSFADAYPLLLCNESSREALATVMGRPLPMARFRPNLVVSGAVPWAEDDWRLLRIGALRFSVASACTRCVFTTVDPERGERDADGEPLALLKRLRQREDGVIFGLNLLPECRSAMSDSVLGKLREGDLVEILE